MKRMFISALVAISSALTACGGGGGVVSEAQAQPAPVNQSWGGWVPHINAVIDGVRKDVTVWVSSASGYLKAATVGLSQVDFAGKGGTAVGGYFSAEGVGVPGVQNEVVGVYGRADKNGHYWATALHGECYAHTLDDGVCIGLNLEPKNDAGKGRHIGINIQPVDGAKNVEGIQFQNGPAYKWAIDLGGAPIRLGDHGGVSMCMRLLDGQLAVNPC